MPLEGDERAVTVVIGAVLMFGILVSALAMYQVNVVPDQNQQAEWDHHQEVSTDLLELRNSIRNTNDASESNALSLSLGTAYNSRTFAINPPPPSGTLSAVEANESLTIEGVSAFDEMQNADPTAFRTSYLTYEPGYYEYDTAPVTTIEHSLLYDVFDDGNVTVEDQSIFREDAISLTAVDGEWTERDSGSASVDVYGLDGPIERTVRDPTDLNVTLPTKNPHHWNRTLHDADVNEYATIEPGAESITVSYDDATGPVTITLARVGVGPNGEATGDLDGISDGTGQYDLIWNKTDVPMDSAADEERFKVTVTDSRTGMPVTDTPIDIYASHSDNLSVTTTARTDENGIVTATVETDDTETGTATLHAALRTSSARSTIDIEDGSGGPSDEPTLDVRGLEIADTDSETQFPVDVTVAETAGYETEDLSVTMTVEAPNGSAVYDQSASIADLSGETAAVTFGEDAGTPQLGPFASADREYTATVTAEASSAATASQTDRFAVSSAGGVVGFEASDVATDATTQQFSFASDDLGQNDEAIIDLSDAQGTSIDYTGGTVSETSGQNMEYVEYDAETDAIVLSPQGNSAGTMTVEIDGIDVIGDVGRTASVGYSDDAGNSESDTFTIEQGVPEFTELEVAANSVFDFWNWEYYSDSVTFDHTFDYPSQVSEIEYTVYDESGSAIGSGHRSGPDSPLTLDLTEQQYNDMTVEVIVHSESGDHCIESPLSVSGTASLSEFTPCD